MKKTYEDAVYPAQLVRTWSREEQYAYCDPDDEEHYSGLRNKWMNALALHHSAQEHLETLLNQK